MEMLETYIVGFCAQDGSCMNYMTRQNLFPPAAGSDIAYGITGSDYNSPDKEITAWHRIFDQSAATDSLMDHSPTNTSVIGVKCLTSSPLCLQACLER